MKEKILVVDDNWTSLKPTLEYREEYKQFDWIGLACFEIESIISKLEADPGIKVLLLDVYEGSDSHAGFRLYEELMKQQTWNRWRVNDDEPRAVQVVFFTERFMERDHANVATQKTMDVSGYVSKRQLYDQPAIFCGIIRDAIADAERYRKYPSLADDLRKLSDLVFSPNTRSMRELWEKVLLAARFPETVLIQGETGTGKELVAKAIRDVMVAELNKNGITKNPGKIIPGLGGFHAYNIGAIPTEGNLQYLELFGAKKGAFTGNERDRIGWFMHAHNHNATLFLDEIGDAVPVVQVALLRVLQEKNVTPLGAVGIETDAEQKLPVANMRLITATNKDLHGSSSNFREDLYYRLSTIEIYVPPLRERLDDIGVLLFHFLNKINEQYEEYKTLGVHRQIPKDKEASIIEKLKSYSWPGNVRQLENFIVSNGEGQNPRL